MLRELGLLDDPAMESVIERAMMTGYEGLSVSEVREIVAAVLFSKSTPHTATGRSMLNNEDSIH